MTQRRRADPQRWRSAIEEDELQLSAPADAKLTGSSFGTPVLNREIERPTDRFTEC